MLTLIISDLHSVKGNPGSFGANILLSEEVDHYMEGIRIAIGEMENTHSSIYREYGMFSAPFEYEIQVLLAILAPVPVSILINLFV